MGTKGKRILWEDQTRQKGKPNVAKIEKVEQTTDLYYMGVALILVLTSPLVLIRAQNALNTSQTAQASIEDVQGSLD